jgi:hypothetical protein
MVWTRAEPGHGHVAMPALLSRILLCAALAEAPQPADLAAQLDGAIPPMRLASGKLSFDGHATVGDFTGTTTTVTGEVTGGESLAGDALRPRSSFPLDFGDYEIGGLTKMPGMLRMREGIEVHVDPTFAPP